MKAFLVDDEALAVSRLKRLLSEDGRVEVVGSSSDPKQALRRIPGLSPDVLFLDIQMPDISGFELLNRLEGAEPLVIFTTAYGEYALDAFKVNSIDYLLKPIQTSELARAVTKLQRIMGGTEHRGNFQALLAQLQTAVRQNTPDFATRFASRMAGKVEFIEVRAISHFYALDKLTFASTTEKDYPLDLSIAEIERQLPLPRGQQRSKHAAE